MDDIISDFEGGVKLVRNLRSHINRVEAELAQAREQLVLMSEAALEREKEIARLREALEKVEFGCDDDDYCPSCGGYPRTGHNFWCELNAALKGAADAAR